MDSPISPIPPSFSESSSPSMELPTGKPSQLSTPQPLSPLGSCESTTSTTTTKDGVNTDPSVSKDQVANPNICRTVMLNGVPIASLVIDGKERLCLAQISNTLLKDYSYNEIHNRRVALGVTCVQCTPVQLEILRRAGAMPISSRRCGMITKREAERLCKSFLEETTPPKLPENFAFDVYHVCAWGCRGSFIPSRYNSSRAKCIKCAYCNIYFSPNKFIFHSHRTPESKYNHPDAANFNSWRRHIKLASDEVATDLCHAWEDVKAMFNGGSRKRVMGGGGSHHGGSTNPSSMSTFGFGLTSRPPEKRSRSEFEQPVLHSSMPRPFGYPLVPVPNKTYTVQGESLLQKKTENGTVNPPYSALDLVAKKHLSPTSFKRGLSDFMWGGNKDPYSSWSKAFGLNMNGYYPQAVNNPNMMYKAQHFPPPQHLSPDRNKLGSPTKITSPLTNNNLDTGRREEEKFCPWDSEIRKKHNTEEKIDDCGDPKTQFLREPHEYVSAFKPVTRDRQGCQSNIPIQPTDLSVHHHENVDGDIITNCEDKADRKMMTSDSEVDASEDDADSDINIIDEGMGPAMAGDERECVRERKLIEEETPQTQKTEENGPFQTPKSPSSSLPGEVSNSIPTSQAQSPPVRPISRQMTSPSKPPSVELASSKSKSVASLHAQCGTNKDDDRYGSVNSPLSLELSSACNSRPTLDSSRTDNNGASFTESSLKNNTMEKNIGEMEKEELEKALLQEMRMRKKMEQECQLLKDTFQNQVKRELAYREEMSQQLQIVRETLCHELDAERKARFAIQQKLKSDDITSQHRRAQQTVDHRVDMDRTLAYWRLAMLGPTCLPSQQWRAMMPIVMNGEPAETGNESIFPAAASTAAGAGRVSARSLEIYGNTRRTSAF
ncbi:SKI family transcriptional corepressor 1 homolog-B-like [Ptychodera flava]|uniref:SKI family transcriptional corepressor 1 homolog-B-like n=1 Tax=Ptychodera flava TaxID=63121 RepID=UPI00396A5F59